MKSRSDTSTEGSSTDLVAAYKTAMCLRPDADITDEMVGQHWTLERQLTQELLASSGDRRETFDRCYTRLFQELPWLNEWALAPEEANTDVLGDWARLIGPPPKRVYEVGSGGGRLITYLAEAGYDCRATEISTERGERLTDPHSRISWGTTDGVNLTKFEPADTFDAVISDQVIEHLHPDDLGRHLREARELLREGGKYIIGTPHRFDGPSDVSAVFGYTESAGMHLKEYTYAELVGQLRAAGYSDIRSALRLPARFRRKGVLGGVSTPRAYLPYLRALEWPIGALPASRRKAAARYARAVGFRTILIVADR